MVLHLGGCGRVGHRHNTLNGLAPEPTRSRGQTFIYDARKASEWPTTATMLRLGDTAPRYDLCKAVDEANPTVFGNPQVVKRAGLFATRPLCWMRS